MADQFRAFLVGVPRYRDDALANLDFISDELPAVAKALRDHRYRVTETLLEQGDTDWDRISSKLGKFFAEAPPGATLLVYLSGHGLHVRGTDYLVPSGFELRDGLDDPTLRLISVDVAKKAEISRCGDVVVFVDACREGVDLGTMGATTVNEWSTGQRGRAARRRIAYVYACSPGQLAYYVGVRKKKFSLFTRAFTTVLQAPNRPRDLAGITQAMQVVMDELRQKHRPGSEQQQIRTLTEEGVNQETPFWLLPPTKGDLEDVRPPSRPGIGLGPEPPGPKRLQAVAASALLVLAPYVGAGIPRPWIGTTPVSIRVACAATLVLAAATVGLPLLIGRTWRALLNPLSRHPRILTALCAVLALTGVIGYVQTRGGASAACPEPTELRVLTSLDGLRPTTDIAQAYERATATHNCPTVHMFVYAVPPNQLDPQKLAGALARGWRDDAAINPLRDIGPQPDMWLADSSLDVDEVAKNAAAARPNGPSAARQTSADSPIKSRQVIAASPLLVSGPASSFPGRTGDSWRELLRKVNQGGWAMVSPTPGKSATGSLAAAAVYAAEGGTLDRLAARADPVALRAVRNVAQSFNAALDRRGEPPIVTATELLASPAGGAKTLLVASEQALIGAGQAAPLAGCPNAGGQRAGTAAVVQPAEAYQLAHELVEFTWAGHRAQTAISGFRDWLLHSPAGGTALMCQGGLRPPATPPAAPAPGPATAPTFDDMRHLLNIYEHVKTPAQVLLAVDRSGSMSAAAPGTDRSRFDVVVRGVQDSLNLMGSQDRFGLWVFAGPAPNHQTLVPVGPGDPNRRVLAITRLHEVAPRGNTPLYKTITDALGAVRPGAAAVRRSVIVFTDGEDTSRTSAQSVIRAVKQATGTRLFIVAAGEARCADQPLAGIAGRRCFQADFGNVRDVLSSLTGQLWGGE